MAVNDRERSIELLREKQKLIFESGENRLLKRSDFTADEVMTIKAHLGPWPRALEAAGLKPERDDDHKNRLLEKRIRAKRRRTAAKHPKNANII